MTVTSARAGRPRRSSRETIEDAAVELFLEQGYPRTSVDQIAQRAGVSRASFFNYFAAKSDVLWVGVDDSAHRLAEELGRVSTDEAVDPGRAMGEAVAAVLAVAADFGPERAPWAVTEAEAMGLGDELGASALPRFAALAAALADHLEKRGGMERTIARSTSAALAAAVATAAVDWARAGSRRGTLTPWVDAALVPLRAGLGSSRSA